MKIKFYEAFEEEARMIKHFLPADWEGIFTDQTLQVSGDMIPPAPYISLRTQSQIPLDWSEKISGLLTRSQGFDHLVKYQKETGFKGRMGFLEEYCSRAVAEQAVWMMLALLRKAQEQIKHFATFNRDGLTGKECLSKSAAVLGAGKIGAELARLIKGMGMKVKAVDIIQRHPDLDYVSFENALAWANVMFICVPLTDKTRHIMNYENLKGMNKGAIIINIARGEVTPIKDLVRLLDEGILGGVGLDVYEDENKLGDLLRQPMDHRVGDPITDHRRGVLEFCSRSNVICTPHNAFNTEEALERKCQLTIKSFAHLKEQGKFLWEVPLK
ncbi:MAG: hydroxyacid dehydrogenase [Candidatus Omnitrophica bacterium]|nr:hydroxyacid dehydrogenase [Candidatus Omnitrophota bacterium]